MKIQNQEKILSLLSQGCNSVDLKSFGLTSAINSIDSALRNGMSETIRFLAVASFAVASIYANQAVANDILDEQQPSEQQQASESQEFKNKPILKLLKKELAQSVYDAGIKVPAYSESNGLLSSIGLGGSQETVNVGDVIVKAKVASMGADAGANALATTYAVFNDARVYERDGRVIIQFQPEIIAQNIDKLAQKFNNMEEVTNFITSFIGKYQGDGNALLRNMLSHDAPGAHPAVIKAANAQAHLTIEQALTKLYHECAQRLDKNYQPPKQEQEDQKTKGLIDQAKDMYQMYNTSKTINGLKM